MKIIATERTEDTEGKYSVLSVSSVAESNEQITQMKSRNQFCLVFICAAMFDVMLNGSISTLFLTLFHQIHHQNWPGGLCPYFSSVRLLSNQ